MLHCGWTKNNGTLTCTLKHSFTYISIYLCLSCVSLAVIVAHKLRKINWISTHLQGIAQYYRTIYYCTRWDIKYFLWLWLTQDKCGFITKTIMLTNAEFQQVCQSFLWFKHNKTHICHAYVRVWFLILLPKVKINSVAIVCLRIAKQISVLIVLTY